MSPRENWKQEDKGGKESEGIVMLLARLPGLKPKEEEE